MDGQHVTLESVNSFLVDKVASATSTWVTIKLTVQRPSIDDQAPRTNSQDSGLSQRVGELNLVEGDAGSRLPSADSAHHMFLYLTKEGVTESSPERADVIFQHPPPSSARSASVPLVSLSKYNIPEVSDKGFKGLGSSYGR